MSITDIDPTDVSALRPTFHNGPTGDVADREIDINPAKRGGPRLSDGGARAGPGRLTSLSGGPKQTDV